MSQDLVCGICKKSKVSYPYADHRDGKPRVLFLCEDCDLDGRFVHRVGEQQPESD